MTQEQVETYFENFSSISKYQTAFFKANKADKEVSGIEVKQEVTVTATIPSEDFDNYIFKNRIMILLFKMRRFTLFHLF